MGNTNICNAPDSSLGFQPILVRKCPKKKDNEKHTHSQPGKGNIYKDRGRKEIKEVYDTR